MVILLTFKFHDIWDRKICYIWLALQFADFNEGGHFYLIQLACATILRRLFDVCTDLFYFLRGE